MRLLATLVLAAVALAGCASPAADRDASPGPAPGPGDNQRDANISPGWSTTEPGIRPGVQVRSDGGQCTANFLYTSLDNASVYLGLAAHCVEGMEIGDTLDIGDGLAQGTLAYSSWITMKDVEETDADALEYNDFALILLDDEARAKANPAMRHFGGPVSLADSASVNTGTKVLTYGNSGLRAQIDPASWHEGYVLTKRPWSTTIYTATPGIPGDSGSGVLTGDGRALGILVTLTIAPTAGSNGVTNLDMALAYAAEKAGIEVVLATAALEDRGLLPG